MTGMRSKMDGSETGKPVRGLSITAGAAVPVGDSCPVGAVVAVVSAIPADSARGLGAIASAWQLARSTVTKISRRDIFFMLFIIVAQVHYNEKSERSRKYN